MEHENKQNKTQSEPRLYLTPATEVFSSEMSDDLTQQNARAALGEFLQTTTQRRVTTIEEELQMLEANLNSVDQLIQKNAFMMREVKYLMKL